MKCAIKILFMIALCAAMVTTIPVTDAEADVRITITFAAGGAACGFYLFFYYSSGFVADWQDKQSDALALFNLSNAGWQVRPPSLQFIGNRNTCYTPYLEIIRIRF